VNLSRKKAVSAIPVVAARSSEPEPILTLEQVAERLQMKPSTVRELIRKRNRNPLPALKAGKFLRFKWSMVERWLDDSRGRAA
jgi:excisionase family DNA binding protein